MSFSSLSRVVMTTAVTLLPGAAFADAIMVMDPYARSSGPNAPAGAAFMVLHNTSDTDDRLVSETLGGSKT